MQDQVCGDWQCPPLATALLCFEIKFKTFEEFSKQIKRKFEKNLEKFEIFNEIV